MNNHFDVIIVGGGHAGCEAALSAARMRCKTLLLTQNMDTLGQMSCNPAMGGIGKGHLVREIDAMGGMMARTVDRSGIQFRRLNTSKGPAVRATRAQVDRMLYKIAVVKVLNAQDNLQIFQQSVDDLIIKSDTVVGVITQIGLKFYARSVVLTVGTFLGGRIYVGKQTYQAGRAGDPPAIALAERLRELPMSVGRLKTGTPPRIDGSTINYQVCQKQLGDVPTPFFAHYDQVDMHPKQVPCYITRTNEQTHDIIRAGICDSPMYSGMIESTGPRYCPSIEDKVTRFADKSSHQIFIEPEGLNTTEIYPNGISTALPYETQLALVRSINGFEQAHITRPGYAIEYDFFEPQGLYPWLETKFIKGLFFAGQINGTTGYEEAAAQGLLAGINAACMVHEKDFWFPRRDQAYLGVLVDDLTTLGTQEPYRMFTSRAEYRLLLREDNADLRLTETAYQLGLVSEQQWQCFNQKRDAIEKEMHRLGNTWVATKNLAQDQSIEFNTHKDYSLMQLLKRPQVNYQSLLDLVGEDMTVTAEVAEQVEIQCKYEGYIKRQEEEIQRNFKHEHTHLPKNLDYQQVSGLSLEVVEKLNREQPVNLGQASRIAGITPVAISLLRVYLKKNSYSS